MNDLTREWVAKAEADFATAQREAAVDEDPNHDAVCFHAQQCVEKLLKAVLQEASLDIPRTHDLPALLGLVLPVAPDWDTFLQDLAYLTEFAVGYRYPGLSATAGQAQRAVAVMGAFRRAAREQLGLT